MLILNEEMDVGKVSPLSGGKYKLISCFGKAPAVGRIITKRPHYDTAPIPCKKSDRELQLKFFCAQAVILPLGYDPCRGRLEPLVCIGVVKSKGVSLRFHKGSKGSAKPVILLFKGK
jgi:hypothetical protein